MNKPELVRCKVHGSGSCWIQSDGSHMAPAECQCATKEPYLCPIDAHAIRFLLENPEWEESGPVTHAPPTPKPAPQDCGHRGSKELRDLPGGLRSWLCADCVQELTGRLEEVHVPPTPVELYALEHDPEPVPIKAGCRFVTVRKDAGGKTVRRVCGLAVADGRVTCPRHSALRDARRKKQQVRTDTAALLKAS